MSTHTTVWKKLLNLPRHKNVDIKGGEQNRFKIKLGIILLW